MRTQLHELREGGSERRRGCSRLPTCDGVDSSRPPWPRPARVRGREEGRGRERPSWARRAPTGRAFKSGGRKGKAGGGGGGRRYKKTACCEQRAAHAPTCETQEHRVSTKAKHSRVSPCFKPLVAQHRGNTEARARSAIGGQRRKRPLYAHSVRKSPAGGQ